VIGLGRRIDDRKNFVAFIVATDAAGHRLTDSSILCGRNAISQPGNPPLQIEWLDFRCGSEADIPGGW
jgi:hypothetical protein